MKQALLLWTLGLWGVLVVCAIINGGFREAVLVPSLGETAGHIISTVILSSVIMLVAYLFLGWSGVERSGTDLWIMGFIWLSLTVLFEFGFGHYVMGHSWDVLLADYNILEGRIWVLVPIITLAAPYLMGSLVDRGGL